MSFVFLIALALVFNVIGMELFKCRRREAARKHAVTSGLRMPAEIQWMSRATLVVLVAVAVIDAILESRAWLLDLVTRPWALPLIASRWRCHSRLSARCTTPWPNVKLVMNTTEAAADRHLSPLVVDDRPAHRLGRLELLAVQHRPDKRQTEHVVVRNGVILKPGPSDDVFLADASNFETRLQALGYKVLIAPLDPPAILADQAPTGTTDKTYDQVALNGWQVGGFTGGRP